MAKKRKPSRGLSDVEDILDTFDAVLEDLLENTLQTGIDPLSLAYHIETYIANWQEQYK